MKKPGYINVDELMQRADITAVLKSLGVQETIHRAGDEIRLRCILACGHDCPSGNRALAINTAHPAKLWQCHVYECQQRGNLVALVDHLLPGDSAQGKPRGERFKEIARHLQRVVDGGDTTPVTPVAAPLPLPSSEESVRNVPLAESLNLRARDLVLLDQKFIVDVADMSPGASRYLRSRPFYTPEVLRDWRIGYLPRDSGGDKSGGTMRGRIVYPYHNEQGELLTWFGRDPDFENKYAAWKKSDGSEREPEKYHFVRGFHRGLELFACHRLNTPETHAALRTLGLVIVEGPNDAVRLQLLGVPAVAFCSNTATAEQVQKIAKTVTSTGAPWALLLLDCDPAGEQGMQKLAYDLAQHCPVRVGWSLHDERGKYQGRQPESLTAEEWQAISERLAR